MNPLQNVEYENLLRSRFESLEDAIIKAVHPKVTSELSITRDAPQQKIVLYGFANPQEAHNDATLASVLAKENAHYLHMPATDKQIAQETTMPSYENVAQQVYQEAAHANHRASVLLHDQKSHSPEWLLENAQDLLGITGSYESVQKQLHTYSQQERTVTNKHLPGLFVDIDGTLIKNNSLDMQIVKELANYSAGPINLYTGGAVHNQIKRVSKLNIEEAFKTIDSTAYMRLPIIGKQGLRGATLERVIDDQNPDELENMYGIGVKNYQNESEISGRIN